MPPIYWLNPPPNPFWDFVNDMQGHPFFANNGSQEDPQHPRGPEATAAEASNTNEKQQETNAEDPPEVDPATLRQEGEKSREKGEMRCRGRRRCGSSSDEETARHREWHARRGHGRGGRHGFGGGPGQFGGQGQFGGPGFPFGGPFWARGQHAPPPPGEHPPGPPGEDFGPGGPGEFPGHGPRGPPGQGPWGRGGRFRGGPRGQHFGPQHGHHGPHGHGHAHSRGHGHGHGPHGPPGGPRGFGLENFLNNLGQRIGVDLSGAAESMGLGRPQNPETDFEPKADIFDREQDYVVHLSLPGAKKSDVGVDWDGEHSVLRVAGVVHRPNVDEKMLEQLAVDGRKRETGVFEKTIRLGTRREPAVIDVAGISAKMIDGVLIIIVPKAEKQHQKRDVPITKSATPSPPRAKNQEKRVFFDADREMRDAGRDGEIQLVDRTAFDKAEQSRGKQAEYEAERKNRESTGTVEAEARHEQLPAYHPVDREDGEDWENFGSDEEGEFVKINVD